MNSFALTRRLQLRNQSFFYLEQWIALGIGLLCLGVSGWAGFSDAGASAGTQHLWFSEYALVRMKCSLAIAVALIGTALVRFAFYKPLRKNRAAPNSQQSPSTVNQPGRGAGNHATRLQLAAHKRRG